MEGYHSTVLHCLPKGEKDFSIEYIPDGLLIVKDGKILACGPYEEIRPKFPSDLHIFDYRDSLIVPGFVDAHIHYPQIEIMASYGEALLPWLENYTFPCEMKMANIEYARKTAKRFVQQLIQNGTTTAFVFASSHAHSVSVLFEEAQDYELQLICGKVWMDINAPKELLQTSSQNITDSLALYHTWHKKKRFFYALLPRFAAMCSHEQFQALQKFKKDYPDVYFQTHLSESIEEILWVKNLFPECNTYLEVYDKYDLLGEKSSFVHGIHLQEYEYQLLQASKSSVIFCPSSNLMLGSGLFNYEKCKAHEIKVALGTDIGAGDSFSVSHILADAYKIGQLQKQNLHPYEMFYLMTLGGARVLSLQNTIGNFEIGKTADFNVLNLKANDLLEFRLSCAQSLPEKLFVLWMLGNQIIYHTYVNGKLRLYEKEGPHAH